MTQPREHAEVTTTVTVGEESRTFTADSTTTGDPYRAADGVLHAVAEEARSWLYAKIHGHAE
jgi:hypothetical protein